MLRSGLLLDVDLVLVDTLIRGPVNALVRAHRVLGRCRLQNHRFTELENWHGILWFFPRGAILLLLVTLRAFDTLFDVLHNSKDLPFRVLLGLYKC